MNSPSQTKVNLRPTYPQSNWKRFFEIRSFIFSNFSNGRQDPTYSIYFSSNFDSILILTPERKILMKNKEFESNNHFEILSLENSAWRLHSYPLFVVNFASFKSRAQSIQLLSHFGFRRENAKLYLCSSQSGIICSQKSPHVEFQFWD